MSSKICSIIDRCNFGSDQITKQELEQFGQIIVQECSLIIESALFHKLDPKQFVNLIKEEFE